MLCAMACSGAALSSSRVEQLNELNEEISQRVELDSPFGSGECSRCGRDGANDYNCCHAGGAWAGICGDEAMIARGAANYTWGQGFVACQERLKRSLFKRPIGTIYRKWRRKKRPNRFEPRAPRTPGSLRSTPSTPSAASVMASGDSGEECFGGLAEQDDAEFAPYGPGISAEAVDAAYRLLAPSDKVGPHLLQPM